MPLSSPCLSPRAATSLPPNGRAVFACFYGLCEWNYVALFAGHFVREADPRCSFSLRGALSLYVCPTVYLYVLLSVGIGKFPIWGCYERSP